MAAIADPPIAAKAAPTINMLVLDSFSDQPGDEGAADQQHLSDKLRGIGKENKVNTGGPRIQQPAGLESAFRQQKRDQGGREDGAGDDAADVGAQRVRQNDDARSHRLLRDLGGGRHAAHSGDADHRVVLLA